MNTTLAAAIFLSLLGISSGAFADEGKVQCGSWRAASKPNDRIELRTCKKTVPVSADSGDDGDSDSDDSDDSDSDEETIFTVEIRNGYDKAKKIRYELTTADGTTDTLETTVKSGVNKLGTCRKCGEHGDVEKWRIIDGAKSGGEQDKKGDDALLRVKGNMHFEVLARDLRLTASDTERLKRIASRYFKATRKRLVVTGGTRTPKRQAQLMYNKLEHGEDIVALYENKAAATEIRNVYKEGTAKNLSRKRLIRSIADAIDAQIARGIYVSKHLKSGAVDVRSWGLTGKQEEALREAVKQESGVTLLDERNSSEPHFHLSLL